MIKNKCKLGALRAMFTRAKSKTNKALVGGLLTLCLMCNSGCVSRRIVSETDKKINKMEQLRAENRQDFDAYFQSMGSDIKQNYDSILMNLDKFYMARDVSGRVSGRGVHGYIKTEYDNYKDFENRFLQALSNANLREHNDKSLLRIMQSAYERDAQIVKLHDSFEESERVLSALFVAFLLICALALGISAIFEKMGGVIVVIGIISFVIYISNREKMDKDQWQQERARNIVNNIPNSEVLLKDIEFYYPVLREKIFKVPSR